MIDNISLHIKRTTVNAGDSFRVDAFFLDGDEADTPNSTASFRVKCLTTGVIVQDWTAIALGAGDTSASILVESDYNALQNTGNRFERKELTVQTDQDEIGQVSARVSWVVNNPDVDYVSGRDYGSA